MKPIQLLVIILLFSCSKESLREIPEPTKIDKVKAQSRVDTSKVYDVVIYGATMPGIVAAIEIKKSGYTVVIVNPPATSVGGMTTNGLGITDVINTRILGGLTRDFYKDIKNYYSNATNWFIDKPFDYARYRYDGDVMIWFEPRAAKFVVNEYISNNEIPILFNERLNLERFIVKDDNNAISYIEMESGIKIKGKYYIDATYEGDIMAKSEVSYTIGREDNMVYGERSNGVQLLGKHDRNEFADGVKGNYGEYSSKIGFHGSGDSRIQAYCFRMCLTNKKENMVSFPKPLNYNENEYTLLFEYLNYYTGNQLCDFMPLPNGKTDSNNFGPISTDYVGQNYKYPDGNYEERQVIYEKHKNYQLGLLWTLANHPKVPERIRNFYKNWGLSKDEFVDNGNWPKQLYIREGRRMISDYVLTEKDCNGTKIAERPIGLADYPMDSHIVRRYLDKNGNIKNEGQVMAAVKKPYPIDYRSIIPKDGECSNLFVPVCLSASHIAYGSVRMEPVFMTLGQSAAVAAVIAIEEKTSVQDVDYKVLRDRLVNKGLVLN